jgi:hypothetical protein
LLIFCALLRLGLRALPRYLPVTFEAVVGWRFGDAHLIAG